MSQGRVVFGQFLRRCVLPGVLWFHRVSLGQGAQAQQRPQQEPQSPQPVHQVRMHLSKQRRGKEFSLKECLSLYLDTKHSSVLMSD